MENQIKPVHVIYEFAPFRLDEAAGRLWREGRRRPLRPKAFAMLAYLVARAGVLVDKRELLSALWSDVIVEEAALTVCVHELRQVLGDDSRNPRYIETRHRRGYVFVAPVTQLQPTGARPVAGSLASVRTVARDL